jgi:hypothetical protein
VNDVGELPCFVEDLDDLPQRPCGDRGTGESAEDATP